MNGQDLYREYAKKMAAQSAPVAEWSRINPEMRAAWNAVAEYARRAMC